MDLQAILAEEYGYLDAKHSMGYNPRPHGNEKEYHVGYWSWKPFVQRSSETSTSYAHKGNWGWY